MRKVRLLTLLVCAALGNACAYGFAHAPPEPPRPLPVAAEAKGVATYALTVTDSDRSPGARTRQSIEDSLLHVLEETGRFTDYSNTLRQPSELLPGDAHYDITVNLDQSGNAWPLRLLTIFTLGAIPSWGDVSYELELFVTDTGGRRGPYSVEGDQTIVLWLPLTLVLVPDVYVGALTGRGNFMERTHRALYRRALLEAERPAAPAEE